MSRSYPVLTLLLTAAFLIGGRPAFAADSPSGLSSAAWRSACAVLNTGFYASPECEAEMVTDPRPAVVPLALDYGAVQGYTFMRIVADGPVTVYANPNGTPLHTIDPGFNFVTPLTTGDEWVEINSGQWVLREVLEAVEPSRFTGVFIQAEPSRPFGWFLQTMYASDYPGGDPVLSEDKHVRFHQISYIYATVNVGGWDWYLVGPGKWIEQRYMGLVKRTARPAGMEGRWVAVDLYEQTLVAYDNDTMVFATLVSTGLPDFSTNEGTFKVWGARLNGPMSGGEGDGHTYMLENVPYALYFDGDISLHGAYWHNSFGHRHSHGCVNLSISDAHWLYDWLGVGGGVYVYSSRPY